MPFFCAPAELLLPRVNEWAARHWAKSNMPASDWFFGEGLGLIRMNKVAIKSKNMSIRPLGLGIELHSGMSREAKEAFLQEATWLQMAKQDVFNTWVDEGYRYNSTEIKKLVDSIYQSYRVSGETAASPLFEIKENSSKSSSSTWSDSATTYNSEEAYVEDDSDLQEHRFVYGLLDD